MPVSAAILRRLAALSLSAEAMAGVLDIIADMQEHDERRREAQRNRKRQSRDGHGTVTETERDEERDADPLPDKEKSPKEINPSPQSSEANASAPLAPVDERRRLFDWGLAVVRRATGKTDGACRRALGKLLKEANDDCRMLNRAIEDAVSANPAEFFPYVARTVRSKVGSRSPPAASGGGFASLAMELSGRYDERNLDTQSAGMPPGADASDVVQIAGYLAQRG